MALPKAVEDVRKDVEALEEEFEGLARDADGNLLPEGPEAEKDTSSDTDEPDKDSLPEDEVPEETGPEEGDQVAQASPDEGDDDDDAGDTADDLSDFEDSPEAGDDWEQKYRTLLGKYNAEVPRLTGDVEFLKGQMEAMSLSKASEKSQSDESQSEKTSEEPVSDFKKYLTESELEEYDDSILEFQSRLVRGVLEGLLPGLLESYTSDLQALQESVGVQQSRSFWDHVEQEYPGAQEINESDPEWVDFLSETDPLTGVSYRDIGAQAVSRGRVDSLVQLLDLFRPRQEAEESDDQVAVPVSRKSGPPVKPARNHGERVELKEQAKRVFSAKEIQKFFTDVSTGKYRGRDAKREALETEIEEAVAEGRVSG